MENKFLGSTGLAKVIERLFDTFSKVGHTHDKSQITDFPAIPTNTSQLTNDSGFITADEINETITVDAELSGSSVNPVQNKVITEIIDDINNRLDIDSIIYVQDDEPAGAEVGSVWIDMDESTLVGVSGSANIELDQTLTIEGMAADAKSVGDGLATKQNIITGDAGQFVVIGDDGNVTTKTILYAEEDEF